MSAGQEFALEQIRFGEKLWAAFGSRGEPGDGVNSAQQHRNLWVDRAFYVMRGQSANEVPRGGVSWYGEYAPLFEVANRRKGGGQYR